MSLSGRTVPPSRRRAALVAVALVAGVLAGPVAGGASPAAAERHDAAPAAAERHGTSLAAAPAVEGRDAAAAVAAVPSAPPGSPAASPGSAGPERPSQMYLDAQAHARDRVAFLPGSRVTVGFTPLPGDTTSVGDAAPRALAAGALSGAQMAAGGTIRPDQPDGGASGALATAPVDAPGGVAGVPAVAAILVPSPGAGDDPDVTTAAARLRRQVYGFLPSWELSSARLHYDVLSYIAYFGVGVDGAGNLETHNAKGSPTAGWAGWTSSAMTAVINAAHRHHARVTLTVEEFAWTPGQAAQQAALLGSPSARSRLARAIVSTVRARGADGVNLDFEPLVPGYQDEFVALIRSIRAGFARHGGGYHVSFDSLGSPAGYPLEAALARGAADAVFVMGYDYRLASSDHAGSVDPLAGPAYDLTDTILAYRARVPASKIVLGIPYYGRAWSTVSKAVNARTRPAARYGGSVSVTYRDAVAIAARYGRRYDAREVSAWTAYRTRTCTTVHGCVTTWRQLYYDDAATLRARYDLVNALGIKGVGIWALGYDGTRRELWQALADKFVHDTTPPRTGVTVLPASQHDEGFVVSWAGADDWSGVAGFDVQVSTDGGPWRTWLTGTKARSDVWQGASGHRYAFRVRARDHKGNRSAWNVRAVAGPSTALRKGGFATVVSATLNVRAAASASASVVGRFAAGDVLAVIGGPLRSGGYTWWKVTGPIGTWQPVGLTASYVWVAGSGHGTTFLAGRRAPNATVVGAGIRGVSFARAGSASLGTSAAAIDARSFSPNGDGTKDGLAIAWTNARTFGSMSLRVMRANGSVLATIALGARGAGVQSASWDGRVNGRRVADGAYLLQLTGSAGGVTYAWPSARPATAAQVGRLRVFVDRARPSIVSARPSGTVLSPNGDGIADRLVVAGRSAGGAARWSLSITRGPTTIRTLAGAGPAASVAWNGRTAAGAVPSDGPCTVTLRFADRAGNVAARSWTVVLDRTPPATSLAAAPAAFSPNGDGVADGTGLAWSAAEPASGTLRIATSSGATVLRKTVSGRSGAVAWTGRDAAGRAVPDGRYTATLSLRDAAGNRSVRTRTLTVDRTARGLRWSTSVFFPQDGDGLAATARLTWTTAHRAAGTLRIYDAGGNLARTALVNATESAGAHGYTWNGKTDAGTWAGRGTYTAVLTVVGRYGTSVLRQAIVADAFRVAPSATSLTAGSRLRVRIASAEPLRGSPTASFRQAGRGPVAMRVVRHADGTWTASATVAAGGSGPAVVTVTGRDSSGRVNAATLLVTVR